MNKINQFLKKNNIQRRCYIALLICWVIIFLDADTRPYITSYVDYLPLVFIIPVILLVLQILFNNRVLWVIILACIILYTLWTFLKAFTYIVVDQHKDYHNTLEWNAATIFRFVFIFLIFIAIIWFLFKIKPLKSDVSVTSIDC